MIKFSNLGFQTSSVIRHWWQWRAQTTKSQQKFWASAEIPPASAKTERWKKKQTQPKQTLVKMAKISPWPQTHENKKSFWCWDWPLEIPSWSRLHWGFPLTLPDLGSLQYHTCCLLCKLVTRLFVPTHCICSILVSPPQLSRAQKFPCTKGSRLETKKFLLTVYTFSNSVLWYWCDKIQHMIKFD